MLDIMTLPVTPIMQNCRILVHQETNDAVVVDPGGSGAAIADLIKTNGYQAKAILITHAHIDHVGGVAQLVQSLDYPVRVIGPHHDEAPLFAALSKQAQMFGVNLSGSIETDNVVDG